MITVEKPPTIFPPCTVPSPSRADGSFGRNGPPDRGRSGHRNELKVGISAIASGDTEIIATLPVHAIQLACGNRWIGVASESDYGIELRVISNGSSEVARIKGLVFGH